MSAYVQRLRGLVAKIPQEIIGSPSPSPTKIRVPTQAFSEFLINRELGDWAEDVVRRGVNDCGLGLKAIRYGRTENLVAGEPGFADFFLGYHKELQEIGKRPDLLIYKSDFPDETSFVGKSAKDLIPLAKKAIAGFEVRSSQQSLSVERTPSDLSFTPKIEDIFNVMRWIEHHEVRHFYVQVVFGAVYAIPFERILEVLTVGPKAGGFRVERVARNQFKTTVYLPLDKGVCISTEFREPDIKAFRRQLSSGRMLFGVNFSGGKVGVDALQLAGLLEL